MMADERSHPRQGQPDSERLGRLITARSANCVTPAEQLALATTSLELARTFLAAGLIPMRPRRRARRWPMSRRRLTARRALMASRRARNLLVRAGGRRRPEPGARLPCSRTGCAGVMQYEGAPFSTGPALLNQALPTTHLAWVCNTREQHGHRALGVTARRRWEDDGGSRV